MGKAPNGRVFLVVGQETRGIKWQNISDEKHSYGRFRLTFGEESEEWMLRAGYCEDGNGYEAIPMINSVLDNKRLERSCY